MRLRLLARTKASMASRLKSCKPRLLVEHAVAVADVEAARRHREIVGDDDLHPVEGRIDEGVDSMLSFTH